MFASLLRERDVLSQNETHVPRFPGSCERVSTGASSPPPLAARCRFLLFVNGPSHRRGALHAAPSHSKWWDFRRRSKERGGMGNAKGPWKGTARGKREDEAALKYCSGPLLPRLLLRFYGRVEQWRIPDVIVTALQLSLRKSARKRGKRWKGIRRGRRRGEGKGCTVKELVYAYGWRSLAADYMDHCARTTALAHVEAKRGWSEEEECGTFARSLRRESGKTRRKDEPPSRDIVVIPVIKMHTLWNMNFEKRNITSLNQRTHMLLH